MDTQQVLFLDRQCQFVQVLSQFQISWLESHYSLLFLILQYLHLPLQILITISMRTLGNLMAIFTLFVIILAVGVSTEDPTAEAPYTQNLSQFKEKKHYNARTQKFLACWLYLRDYERETNSKIEENQWLSIMKSCMKKISRKYAVLKITELGKRNMEPVAPLSNIINIQQQLKQVPASYQKTQFDQFLIMRSKQFKKQIEEIHQKGTIESQIEEELKKRQKYYLGFIPASAVNHVTILIAISTTFMCCFTWCKYYRILEKRRAQRKAKNNNSEDGQDGGEEESMIKSKNEGKRSKSGGSKKKK